jgi:hypothetical protein
MKKKIAFVFVILAVLLAACGTKSATPMLAMPATEAPMRSYGVGGGVTDEQGIAPGAPSPALDTYNSTDATAAAQARMVIMNVNLSIVVSDPQAKVEAISQLASNLGGWVVSMNMYQTSTASGSTAPEGTISIRVPAEKLDGALTQIKADAVEVRNEDRSGQDVTSNYVDLQSQLVNLERAEQDLLLIMDEAENNPGNDSTTKTQDVLNVYNQIVSIRGQIEQIKGQMKYIEESTSTSSINVTLIAEETVQPIQVGGWKPEGKVHDALQALIKFWQGFVNFLIYLVLLILPVVITIFGPIALVVWFIIALIKRSKKKKAQAAGQ